MLRTEIYIFRVAFRKMIDNRVYFSRSIYGLFSQNYVVRVKAVESDTILVEQYRLTEMYFNNCVFKPIVKRYTCNQFRNHVATREISSFYSEPYWNVMLIIIYLNGTTRGYLFHFGSIGNWLKITIIFQRFRISLNAYNTLVVSDCDFCYICIKWTSEYKYQISEFTSCRICIRSNNYFAIVVVICYLSATVYLICLRIYSYIVFWILYYFTITF